MKEDAQSPYHTYVQQSSRESNHAYRDHQHPDFELFRQADDRKEGKTNSADICICPPTSNRA